MTLDFKGKTVAVSGAGIGFGRAISQRFVAAGAKVYGCDIRDDPLAEIASADLVTDRVDLTDRKAGAAWIRSIEERSGGPIDVLVSNAGGVAGQSNRPLEEVEDADWDRILEINLGSAFTLCRAAAPAMKRAGRGAIVTITSGAALQASLTGIQAYCSAKHALLGLTRQLAHELGPHGIRVNSVAPGFVRTNEATERQWASYSPEKQNQIVESVALKRLGTADEIAKAVMFLASDLASFVNGQILSVDGGK
ncbi:MAG: SDR family oxidoreductase [Rhizobiales bacterium]|nr:SDR family oxidoreductase [Hyphomicrobiales bacterium]